MYNMDGFNERTNFIRNSNDRNRLNSSKRISIDNSFAKMRVEENRPNIKTTENIHSDYIEDTKGNRENFVLRNYNMAHVNRKLDSNPVNDALRRNRFKKV